MPPRDASPIIRKLQDRVKLAAVAAERSEKKWNKSNDAPGARPLWICHQWRRIRTRVPDLAWGRIMECALAGALAS
jgi:hypothetical protein